jgi:hypothetical protein
MRPQVSERFGFDLEAGHGKLLYVETNTRCISFYHGESYIEVLPDRLGQETSSI